MLRRSGVYKSYTPGPTPGGSTSMLGPLGHEYELERQPEAGTHIYLFPFGGNPSPIWVHEHRETNIGSEAGDHSYLSLIIDNPSPGEAQELREDSDDGDMPKHTKSPPPPPHPLTRGGGPWENLGRHQHTPYSRGGDPWPNSHASPSQYATPSHSGAPTQGETHPTIRPGK